MHRDLEQQRVQQDDAAEDQHQCHEGRRITARPMADLAGLEAGEQLHDWQVYGVEMQV
jgi:hypothetical protein